LAGCAGRGGPVPYDVPNFAAPDSDRPVIGNQGILGKLDVISVAVFQLPELNRDLQIDTNGNFAMPLVGTIHADGLTADQVGAVISDRLAANYVRNPSVQVSIKQTVVRTVTVEGAVKKPGVFEVRGQTDLLSAIALAAGPDDYSNVHRVVVFRQIDGERKAAAFDLATIRNGTAPNPVIFGNDIIVMDGSSLAKTYRDVLQAVPLLYFAQVL
jgi:polysaccharide export outer membrane protein